MAVSSEGNSSMKTEDSISEKQNVDLNEKLVSGGEDVAVRSTKRKYKKHKKFPCSASSSATSIDKTLNSSRGERVGKPGRKSMHELLDRYRAKLLNIWNTICNFMVFFDCIQYILEIQ